MANGLANVLGLHKQMTWHAQTVEAMKQRHGNVFAHLMQVYTKEVGSQSHFKTIQRRMQMKVLSALLFVAVFSLNGSRA